VLAKALNMSIGLRVSPMEEEVGWISVPMEKDHTHRLLSSCTNEQYIVFFYTMEVLPC